MFRMHGPQSHELSHSTGAMQLIGKWMLRTQATNATDGKGQPDCNIGVFRFRTIAGTSGRGTDQLGGVD